MNARPLASDTPHRFWGGLLPIFLLSFCIGLISPGPGALCAPASTPSNAPEPTALSVLESVSLRARTDLNEDRKIDADDLLVLLQYWHRQDAQSLLRSDINEDGAIDFHDLLEISEIWQEPVDPTPLVSSTFTPTPDDNETGFFTPTWTSTPSPSPTATPVDPELFYYSDNRKIYLTPSQERIAVAFKEGISELEKEEFLTDYQDLQSFIDDAALPGGLIRIKLSRLIEWLELKVLLDYWSQDSRIQFDTPVFETSNNVEMLLSETFSVRFMPEVTDEQIDEFNEIHSVMIVESGRPPHRGGWFLLRPIMVGNAQGVLELANLYYESQLTEFSVPNFLRTNILHLTYEENIKWSGTDQIARGIQAGNSALFFYYSDQRKIPLPLSLARIGVSFRDDVTRDEREIFTREQADLGRFLDDVAMAPRLFRIELTKPLQWKQIEQTMKDWSQDRRVSFVTPVFEWWDGVDILLTDTFSVKFSPEASESEIEALNVANDVMIVESDCQLHRWGWFILRPISCPYAVEVLRLANLYYESDLTECSVPNFQRTDLLHATTPDDTLFDCQWHLNNTGQDPPGGTQDSDIDAPEGWDLETGSSDIIIAVIDSGIDLDHPDLDSNIWVNTGEIPGNQSDDDDNGFVDDVYGWDFSANPEDGVPDDIYGHGTACAGLIAAEGNNDAGVSGVVWNSKVMGLRIFGDTGTYAGDLDVAAAILYAANNGAHVLSCSWGGGPPSDSIISAIKEARNEGRNGKGCIVVFSSGNNGSAPVVFPGYLKEVISVAAVSEDGLAYNWNNDGWELEVVAPSGNRGTGDEAEGNICTTDIRGSAGLNDQMDQDDDDLEDADYTIRMGGTSASCPQVAGLAALLLSQNPELTAAQVQSLIMATADDGGASGYDGDFGWGRINVYRALATATALATPGPSRFLLHDSEGKGVAGIDEFGFLYLTGQVRCPPYYIPTPLRMPTPHPGKDEFILYNSSPTPSPVAMFVPNDDPTPKWDLYLYAPAANRYGTPIPTPASGDFAILNSQSTPVALITGDGFLYLKGEYYEGCRP